MSEQIARGEEREITRVLVMTEQFINDLYGEFEEHNRKVSSIIQKFIDNTTKTTNDIEELNDKTECTLRVSEKEIMDFIMTRYGYEVVDVKHLANNFPKRFSEEYDAKMFLDWFNSWVGSMDGTSGGIGIYQSTRTKQYFVIYGHSNFRKITLYLTTMDKEHFETWLNNLDF
jgi:hypothetical protein